MQGYKTLIVAILVTIFGALQGMDWLHLVSNQQTAGWVITGIGVAMAVLRTITTTPIGTSTGK